MKPGQRAGVIACWLTFWSVASLAGFSVYGLTLVDGMGNHADAMAPWVALGGLVIFIMGCASLKQVIFDKNEKPR